MHFYQNDEKSRPPSASRSTWLASLSDKLETPPTQVPSAEFFTEEWENQNDFCYLSPVYYECESNDISACAVSPATKAKFCFPSKDPAENLVDDIRSDSEKVTDILRIWSQILTPDEKLIWSDIAERDLAKTISLNSGIRIPKSFIECDIRAFRD